MVIMVWYEMRYGTTLDSKVDGELEFGDKKERKEKKEKKRR